MEPWLASQVFEVAHRVGVPDGNAAVASHRGHPRAAHREAADPTSERVVAANDIGRVILAAARGVRSLRREGAHIAHHDAAVGSGCDKQFAVDGGEERARLGVILVRERQLEGFGVDVLPLRRQGQVHCRELHIAIDAGPHQIEANAVIEAQHADTRERKLAAPPVQLKLLEVELRKSDVTGSRAGKFRRNLEENDRRVAG
mmetsp:Transcript_25010/g.77287  ORF Transcript_25010/g.77287 Transcript_25010/m.77287 type:complete len:201 (-) Transcript_25010:1160-1762(-)